MNEQRLKTMQKMRATVHTQLENCLSFWLKYGLDPVNGGVYTCLDRTGNIYSTDKSVWMQGRCAWTFSRLCRVYGIREEWLNAAKSCLDFMEAHCINRQYGQRMYFTVTADGQPLRQRRYHFSEAFYAMANAEYYAVTGEATKLKNAGNAYELVYQLNNDLMTDPTGLGPKTTVTTRNGRGLANPMIYLNLSHVMRHCAPERTALYDERARECADQIFRYHHKPELGCTLETVGRNGEFWDQVTEGRTVNPGHMMECCWFLLAQVIHDHNKTLLPKVTEMFHFAWDKGWDHEYGGLLYFTDARGLPPEAYEHDMKLWWPHNELLIAALSLYQHTGEEIYWRRFETAYDYAMQVFPDPQYGEWYGYLRRDGEPTRPPVKGSTYKGPFHLPRMLMMLEGLLDELILSAFAS